MIKLSVVLLLLAGKSAHAQSDREEVQLLRVLSFNILQGGADATSVGFPNKDFGGSRYDELAAVIRLAEADVVGVQDDDGSDRLLTSLGKGWVREGSVYSKNELTLVRKSGWMTVCRVRLPSLTIVFANCHWRPSAYGPFQVQDHLREHGALNDRSDFEHQILESSDKTHGDRGDQQTLDVLNPLLAANESIVLTGGLSVAARTNHRTRMLPWSSGRAVSESK